MQIVKIPNPILKVACAKVSDIQYAKDVLAEMRIIAEENNLAGLSANQVGISFSFFIIKFADDLEYTLIINPIFKGVKSNGRKFGFEGCGSIPDAMYMVERWKTITVEYLDENNKIINRTLSGINAVVFQHETDHLRGILLTDKNARQIIMKG